MEIIPKTCVNQKEVAFFSFFLGGGGMFYSSIASVCVPVSLCGLVEMKDALVDTHS